MSFTHLDYDPCTYQTNLTQSVGPGDYMIATPASQCSTCLPVDPWLQGGGAVSRCRDHSLIDVDSELHNLSRPATNCPAGHYRPSSQPYCGARVDFPDCRTQMLSSEDTRLTNPPCTLRCTGWNRWEWLCKDPQDRVEVPFDWNINSKQVAKDNHRPCIPTPLDQSHSFPIDNGREVRWSSQCQQENLTDLHDNMPRVDWRSCSTMHMV